jgi:hypothetical protein
MVATLRCPAYKQATQQAARYAALPQYVDGISCFAAPSWDISYLMGGVSCGSSDGCVYCRRCLRFFKQPRPKTIKAVSSMPSTTASIATFAPVERPDEDVVFAFGLADGVEDEIVDLDIVEDSVLDAAALLDEVEDTPANSDRINTALHRRKIVDIHLHLSTSRHRFYQRLRIPIFDEGDVRRTLNIYPIYRASSGRQYLNTIVKATTEYL